MKVVLFDPLTGGHHVQYASFMIQYLAEQGDQITFVSWKRDESLAPLIALGESVSVRYVTEDQEESFGGNALKNLRQLLKGYKFCFEIANQQQADIVHDLYVERRELPLVLRTFGESRTWKLFATIFWPYFLHDADEDVAIGKWLYHGASHRALGSLLKRTILEGLFVHTDAIKADLLRSWGNESLDHQIHVVPDPAFTFDTVPQEVAREHLELPQDKPMLLFFGGLRWDKGPDILFEALPLLCGDWSVVVAGTQQDIGLREAEEWRRRVKEPWRLITRFGRIPDADMPKYFAAADAVVLPYRKIFKGTSGVLQQAAAAGKPIIATDVGQIGETVSRHSLGLVVEPESPNALAAGIQEFLSRKEEICQEVLAPALKYANDNDWRNMAKKVREAYMAEVQGQLLSTHEE